MPRSATSTALGRVRFIHLYSGTHLGDDWDGADNDLTGSHNKMAAKTDKPISGLLKDLRARGLSDSTLVIWGSEFGCAPLAEGRNGRDQPSLRLRHVVHWRGRKGWPRAGCNRRVGSAAHREPFGVSRCQRDMRLTDAHGENEFTRFLLNT